MLSSSLPGAESTWVSLLFAAAKPGDADGAAASAAEMGHQEAKALLPGMPLRLSSPCPVSAPLAWAAIHPGDTLGSVSALLPDQGNGEGTVVLFGFHCSHQGEVEGRRGEENRLRAAAPTLIGSVGNNSACRQQMSGLGPCTNWPQQESKPHCTALRVGQGTGHRLPLRTVLAADTSVTAHPGSPRPLPEARTALTHEGKYISRRGGGWRTERQPSCAWGERRGGVQGLP